MAFSRREFLSETVRSTIGSLAAFSLAETFARHDLFAAEVKPLTRQWLAEVNQLSLEAKQQKVQALDWQSRVEALYEQVDLADLLRSIDFDKLTANLQFVDNGAKSLKFTFREEPGIPTSNVAFGKQIFALKKGCSVVPHGHNNMNTAFLVLKGELHGRHYDRLRDEKEHLIIRPTIDQKFRAGGHSSISDVKDNIHWFKAESETAFIFNIHVMDVRPGSGASTGRVYVDPQGEKLADGTIRAKLVGYKEVHQKYG